MELADEDAPTPAEKLRSAFSHVVAEIIDGLPPSAARQRAIETVITCHEKVASLLSAPRQNGGLSGVWLHQIPLDQSTKGDVTL